MSNIPNSNTGPWPAIPFDEGRDTVATLQLWTQIIGKIRLVQTPWLNHSWHVPLYVTVNGLSTGSIPYDHRIFQIDMDFIRHELVIRVADGRHRTLALQAYSVADFYARVISLLAELGLPVDINEMPNEIADPIAFSQDTVHHHYDADYANRLWQVLLQSDRVFRIFRTGFLGKSSPVHFFWGSFDLAATRFSGRPAPLHPGGVPHLSDAVTREAYSHEVSSAGFWPGGGAVDYPVYYSYAYPMPRGFDSCDINIGEAFFHKDLGEFLLPYEAVRKAPDPDSLLLDFLQNTYVAAAELANWDRAELECEQGRRGVPRALSQ